MTLELAQAGSTLPPVSLAETEIRRRRLERLRTLDPGLRTAASLVAAHVPPPPLPADAHTRAAALADEIGGRVVRGDAGPIVLVEQELELPLDPTPLASLPYPVDPARPFVLLDTETTGLSAGTGTVAFLIGVGRWDGTRLRVTQYWLPDHAAEPSQLALLDAAIPPDAWLVTYNGRSFDWPLLTTRYRFHRRQAPFLAGHLDLLPICRQLFKHRLPDARLASVEAGVAGVRRYGDLPGSLIPDRYFTWLRTGMADRLREVRDHNHQDVVSLGQLLVVLAEGLAKPDGRTRAHPEDVASLGRAYRRSGRKSEALECIETALSLPDPEPWGRSGRFDRGQAWLDQAALLITADRETEAVDAWMEATRCGGRTAVHAWIALAKHREHRRRDPVGALEAAQSAAAIVARQRTLGRADTAAEKDLSRRMTRLRRRLARLERRSPIVA